MESRSWRARRKRRRRCHRRAALFDAIAGAFISFFGTYGALALLMLLAISLYQLGYFVSGPMYAPTYVDIGLSKDMVVATSGSFGLIGTYLGVAFGGYLPLRWGIIRALIIAGVALAIGTMLYAVLPYFHDPITFSAVMLADNFGIATAGITLVAYMSSLTRLGYTATQYALLSSAYALAGKFLKGFSGLTVESLSAHLGLMNAYAVFFIGCGLLGIPALMLFAALGNRQRQSALLSVNPN